MATVFISHSSKDQAFAESLAVELSKYGHKPAGDVAGITVSSNWDETLLKAIADSDVVVFLFTGNAIGSENILSEVGSAKVLNSAVKRPDIIPVVFQGGALPFPLSQVWAQIYQTPPTATELGAKINSLIASLPANTNKNTLGPAFAGDKVTLSWLREFVPVSYFLALAGILITLVVSTFALGVKAGQIPWVAALTGDKVTPAAITKNP
jgi:hypothetical protein